MIQDITPHVYHNQFSRKPVEDRDFILIFSPQGVLCRVENGVIRFPTLGELGLDYIYSKHLFSIDDRFYYLYEGGAPKAVKGWDYHNTRLLRDGRADETLFALGAGESLWRWYDTTRFCGRCGHAMDHGATERSRVCPQCGNTVYPKICPAVIVLVHDGERLVLTRYRGRPFNRYALVAGFNEIGETIEETVRREVLEEVGLHVTDLKFYKSQPWVFTDSLLMGFFARLDGDDAITLQEDELAEAHWFSRAAIPGDHSNISLTGEMIEYFRHHGPP